MSDAFHNGKVTMRVLVTYASKYGATRGIAERIARTLDAAGHATTVRPMRGGGDVDDHVGYDAYVIGSAVYVDKWLPDAQKFVRRNQGTLADAPVWLFSSGPLEVPASDAARKQLAAAIPKDIAALAVSLWPHGHRMFSGALDATRLTGLDRLVRALPGGKALLPDGDFRDWSDIDDWSMEIALGLDERRAKAFPDDRSA